MIRYGLRKKFALAMLQNQAESGKVGATEAIGLGNAGGISIKMRLWEVWCVALDKNLRSLLRAFFTNARDKRVEIFPQCYLQYFLFQTPAALEAFRPAMRPRRLCLAPGSCPRDWP